MVEGAERVHAEVKRGESAAHEGLADDVIAFAEQEASADEKAEAEGDTDGDAGGGSEEFALDGPFEEVGYEADGGHDADTNHPGSGDGVFHCHALGTEFVADKDPLPDAVQDGGDGMGGGRGRWWGGVQGSGFRV